MAHPGYSVGGPGYSVSSPAHSVSSPASSGLFRCLLASSGFNIRGWTVSHPGKCDCYAQNDPNQPDHHGLSGIFGPGRPAPDPGKCDCGFTGDMINTDGRYVPAGVNR